MIADLSLLRVSGEDIAATTEIEEIRWIAPARQGNIIVAPLTEHHILPVYLRRANRAAGQAKSGAD
ncbi:hypothetical protein FHX15_003636 [Rhizobium sp. BK650]|uniref:hypothetical protein n=1 Tax=Rhizobium sp. BK650 TaxID=2586990 RepID=UPI00161FCC3E|nr:hypothetical protein [Rhizobium sp. BK650]MBB3658389.1 hypothetical protein [Rhizobium sp. BK650]